MSSSHSRECARGLRVFVEGRDVGATLIRERITRAEYIEN
jgi:hypothetical protein